MAQDSSLPDFWNTRYQNGVTPWEGASLPLVARSFFEALPRGGRALVPGCGSAGDALALSSIGFQVDAIDFSSEAVARAQVALSGSPVRLWQADFFALPEDGAYSLILERAFLCALPPALWADYAKKMASLLKPDGLLAGVFFGMPTPKGPPFGIALEDLKAMLEPLFKLEAVEQVGNGLQVFAGQEFWMRWRLKN
ncbi:methyltransferase domain-containing protein [uncultured Aquitalea sp.]|uniref:methyltransferase domain-containing protein n=1 Tax=uncultured Aquitalea sp. TaxID=540272 RepID=UPI0025D91EED|nr:methyltransferase domain-containing protein [uncultured Aquitalea sp.]